MSRRSVSVAQKVTRLRDLTRRQVNLARKGYWPEVQELMEERAEIMRQLDGVREGIMSPLKVICLQIEELNEQVENLIGEEQEKTMAQLSDLRRTQDYISAYAKKEVPTDPEYLDERK